jgi:hypothetical protein
VGDFPPHMRVVLFGDTNPNHAFGFDAAVRVSDERPRHLDIVIGTLAEERSAAKV